MRKTAVVVVLAFALLASAGRDVQAEGASSSVTWTLPQTPQAQAFLAATGMDEAHLNEFLTQKLNQLFQTTDAVGFLRKFGDAQGFTSRGLGVDYASEATYFEIGGAASFAMGMDRTYQPSNTQGFPIQGVGLNASVMGGLSLGFLGVPVMVFGNFMKVPTMDYGSMSGSLDNWGVHAQVRLFGPSRDTSALKLLVRWGGIAITTGVDSSHMALGLHKDVSSNFTIPNNTAYNIAMTGSASGSGQFKLDMVTRSIPLEITTSVRLMTLLTLYGGMGFDWQLGGGSSMDLNLDANLVGRSSVSSDAVDLGQATVTANAKADPSAAKIRGILGAQVNLTLVRIFTQLNFANTNPVMASIAVGARLAY